LLIQFYISFVALVYTSIFCVVSYHLILFLPTYSLITALNSLQYADVPLRKYSLTLLLNVNYPVVVIAVVVVLVVYL